MSDEEIQKRFESGDFSVGSESDRASYRAVFRAISREPVTNVSDSFAERIVKKIVAQQKREARRDFIWLTFGVVFLLVGLIVTAALAGLKFELGFLEEMSGYAGVFIFGIATIIGFSWMEKRILAKTT
jgi:hypothetical protein